MQSLFYYSYFRTDKKTTMHTVLRTPDPWKYSSSRSTKQRSTGRLFTSFKQACAYAALLLFFPLSLLAQERLVGHTSSSLNRIPQLTSK
jgi:hypothetical protein